MDDQEQELELVEAELEDVADQGLGAFLVGLAIGVAVGAGAAMLAMPRKQSLGRRVRRRLEEFGEDARERAEDWRDEASRRLGRRKRRGWRSR